MVRAGLVLVDLHPDARPAVLVRRRDRGGARRAAPQVSDGQRAAARLAPDQRGELLGGGDRPPVHAGDLVPDREPADRRQPGGDLLDHDVYRVSQLAQRGHDRGVLGDLELLRVLLVDLLLGLVGRVDHLTGYHRVVAAQPPAQRVPQGELVLHPDGHHAELALGLRRRAAGQLDHVLVVVRAQGVPGRAGRQRDVGHADAGEGPDDEHRHEDRADEQGRAAPPHPAPPLRATMSRSLLCGYDTLSSPVGEHRRRTTPPPCAYRETRA